jgi:hypothetical protein
VDGVSWPASGEAGGDGLLIKAQFFMVHIMKNNPHLTFIVFSVYFCSEIVTFQAQWLVHSHKKILPMMTRRMEANR